MTREFYTGRWWVWAIQALSYIGILYIYCTVDGAELCYCIYIPLDFAIFIAMSSFFFYYKKQDERRKHLDTQLQEMI